MTRTKMMSVEKNTAPTPKLRFPAFRGRAAWEDGTLGQRSEVVRGGSPRPIDGYLTTDSDGLNWLKIGDVEKGSKYVCQTQERVKPEALSKTREVNPGDLILSNSMSFGRPYILEIKACIHDGWIAVTEISGEIDRDFLYYLISSQGSQAYFEDNAAGGGVRNLNADIIKALPLAYPDKQEQQKIAECLSTLDELIGAENQKLDALKTHKKGLMQQLFPRDGETLPFLRFPDFQDGPEWEMKALSQAAENLDNRRVPITAKDRTPGSVPYYGASGIVDHVRDHLFDEDLLCVSEDGANLVARTYPIAFSISGKTWVNNHAHVLRFESRFMQKMVEEYLNAIDLADYLTGMAQPKLNKAMLDKIAIPLPSPEEQKRIASLLSGLDDLVAAQRDKLEALTTHKCGLMQQLFPMLEAA